MSRKVQLKEGDVWLDGEGPGSRWIGMPVSVATTPQAGRIVQGPRSWVVAVKDGCAWVVFYKNYYSPQCNDNRAIVERILDSVSRKELEEGGYTVEIRGLGFTFLPHSCSDYY